MRNRIETANSLKVGIGTVALYTLIGGYHAIHYVS